MASEATKTDDGGAAVSPASYGLSLRDWFAGQALVGILGSRNGFLVDVGTQNAPEWAYQVADGMLAHRSAQKVSAELIASIETLGLTARAVNVLNRLGCQTVGDVTRLDKHALIAAKNSGITTQRAIIWALEERGLSLADRKAGAQ